MFVMTGYAATWVLSAHHVPDVPLELNSFVTNFSSVLFSAGLLWVIYLALEPFVRRFWPDGILGWTRLMSGYVRDPRVGRDVLIGCVVAVGIAILQALYNYLPPLLGFAGAIPPFQSSVTAFNGISTALNIVFERTIGGVFVAMFAVLGYVLLRLAFRRTAFAIAAAVVLLALVQGQQLSSTAAPWWTTAIYQAMLIGVIATIVVRYGLLVTAVAAAVGNVIFNLPLTYSLSHWTATTSNLSIAVVLGLTLFGFYAARAGQPLFGKFEVVKSES